MVRGVWVIYRLAVIVVSLLIAMFCPSVAEAGESTSLRTEITNPAFRTLQTKVNGNDQLPPVIVLGGDDVLTVSFDELSSELRYMRYELIHCDAGWDKDALLPSDYVEGFNEGIVETYDMSQATLIQYVHYEIDIPNPRMKIKLSGNYILRVYDEAEPAVTLLQVRFSVVEPGVRISADVTSRTDIDYNRKHQQLTLEIDAGGMYASSMMNDIVVTVTQNGRTDNQVSPSHPTRISGQKAIWEHDAKLIFPAGNEYRRMETVTVNYPGMHVADIDFIDPYYHFQLETDFPRRDSPYVYDSTQKGRYRVRSADSDDSDTEAEYVMVHFTLDAPEMPECDIFIDGDLTLRQFSPESLMMYNRITGQYEASMLLKQGSYNYRYLTVKRGSARGETGPVEGNFFQTENEYIIMVYYREPGARYDRLIGVSAVTAGN